MIPSGGDRHSDARQLLLHAQNWEYSIIFPAYSSCVLCNDLYGMVYFLDIGEKTVPVFLVITGKIVLIIRVIPINS